MNRKSRSITRRSSILKIDVNREDDTRDIGASSRRSSRRVSFAEMCQIKEFPRDSPKVYKDVHSEDVFDGKDAASSIAGSKNSGITGLDKLLTGAIQTPYQDVAEYPIPEMSSESFNIFDINKTVLDTVDMETTQVGGDIDTFLPQMDFQNEPSMEQKFDAYSFLRSLNGRQNNRMETMQIYSPKRASGPSFTSDFHIMEYNKENVIPMESLPTLNSDYQEPPASLDSKLFLQRLFGGATREVEESLNGMEMDDIACTDNTAKTLPTSVSSHNNDVTKYFDTEDVTVGIEETKCIGGIVVEGHHMDHDKENCVHFANQTLNMEETHPLGRILKAGNTASQAGLRMQQGYYTSITAEDNITRCFNMEGDADDDLEETKCVGGILNKVDKSYITSECVSDNLSTTRDLIESKNSRTLSNLKEKTSENVLSNMENDKNRKLNEDMTVNFNVTGLQDKMEETRTVGGFLDKTLNATRNEQQEHEVRSFIYGKKDLVNDTVAMEETVPLGKILDSGHSSCHFDQSQVKMSLTPAEQLLRSVTTSESKQVQGIWRDSTDDKLNISGIQREEMEFTKNFTVPMEITKPVREFFDKSRAVGGDGPNNSLNCSVMEETKAVGGILDNSIHKTTVDNRTDKDKIDKTIDYTVEMEETRATGRILEKINSEMDNLGEKPTSNAKNAYVPISIEKMKTVGGNLNKTLDRTVVFDDVDTNWLSEDLKPESIGKAADGTTADVVNKTLGIEETNCLGGILTSDMEVIKENAENIYYHAHASEDDKTTMETVQMEETRCVTKETTCELSQKIVNESLNNQPELYQSSTRNFFKAAQAESVLNVNSNENETGKTAVNDKFDSGDIIVDDEITLKFSNKRNFEEYSGEKQDKGQEKTKEITQTGLAKLKEQLILSKRKTAHSLRQGDIRTPSKFSPLFPGSAPGSTSKSTSCSKLDLGETRSPVHKRQRLSDGMQAVDEFGTNERSRSMASPTGDIEGDCFTSNLLENLMITHENIQGIDDEQMPDTMHLDLCTSSSTADIHRDKNSTVQSDRVSTTVQEAYETHSSGNDTRNSSSVNLSLFSNKSFAYSTVVPDGPLSLESFFKLTFTLSSKVQGTRCSTVFAPNIDMDDLGEVLNAELTLTPMVQAKKKMKELFLQQIQKSKDEMEWLEKSLEETQPEIFQKCAKASSEELQEITGQLRSLLSACHTEARIAWKEGTKQMLTEALHDIQGTGVRRAEEMLETVRSDSQTLDNILTSLDDEVASLDEKDRKLEELQNKQDILNREMEKLSLALQQKSVEESDLYSELSKRQQADEVVTSLKQDILSHLMCCEWNLVKMEEDTLEFSFLDDKLNLVVSFSPGVQEKQISNIMWKSQSPSKVLGYFEDRVAVELALNGINTTALKQKFATFSAVPELMHEVSSSVNEIKRFCEDLEDVHLYHMLTFQNNSICTELWDRETQDFITVSFRFDPGHPLTSHAEPSAAVKIGTLKSCDIEDALRAVIPGPGYLSRLIKAVDFKQLRNISASK